MKKDFYLIERILIVCVLLILLLLVSLTHSLFLEMKQGSYLVFIVLLFLFTGLIYFAYCWVCIPYKESSKALRLFSDGYILRGVFDLRVHFNREIALTFDKFAEIIDTKELIEGSKKHAEYLALQNQINPHFLYNTLEGIRSEALVQGVESIANMTEALETFFRYTISNVDKLTTLEEEVENVKNYYTIQKFRFGDKIDFKIEAPDEHNLDIFKMKVPKLTLQPVVENAVFHGIEPKMGHGVVTLRVQATPSRLLICVSDDGVGMEEKHVRALNDRLRESSLTYVKEDKQKGGIALLNVNNRIKLLFGDEYGIYLYSRIGSGTDVEISLPLMH